MKVDGCGQVIYQVFSPHKQGRPGIVGIVPRYVIPWKRECAVQYLFPIGHMYIDEIFLSVQSPL